MLNPTEITAIDNAENAIRSNRDKLRIELMALGLVEPAETATYSGGYKAITGARDACKTQEQRDTLAAWKKLAADYNSVERVGATIIKALRKAEAKAAKEAKEAKAS